MTKYSDTSTWAEEPDSGNSDGSKASEDTLQEFGKLPDSVVTEWSRRFHELDEEWRSQGAQLKWCVVEGWHLYYDPVRIE
ncbi:unnamed protein product [Rhizoctonia solani]|uniref:Uncharacterized protein n=1 Tax=Rhizoctonia solani TaxID=456999 RepID=A0A8H3ANY4_9AGAM|nr:unnamed protein product [Rhizoctonia solani]